MSASIESSVAVAGNQSSRATAASESPGAAAETGRTYSGALAAAAFAPAHRTPHAGTRTAYWAATSILLSAGLLGVPGGTAGAILLTAVQCVHFALRGHRLDGLPLQVRAGYLALLIAGLWPPLWPLPIVLCIGVWVNALCEYCLLARLLSLLPMHRRQPLARDLVVWTLFSTPGSGSILERRARQWARPR